MSIERLRKYARTTARELTAHEIPTQPWTVGGHSYTTSRTEGRWIFKKSIDEVVHVPVTVVVDGCRVWAQVVSITEYRLSGGFPAGGWQEQKQIWLSPDGELLGVEAKTAKWESGRSYPDQAESVQVASDADIRFADEPWHSAPLKPRVPRGGGSGRWDSGINLRRGERLPEGMRISMALTDLRKSKGTYVSRNRMTPESGSK